MEKAVYWVRGRRIDMDQDFLGLGVFGPEEYEWRCSGCDNVQRGGSSAPSSCDDCGRNEHEVISDEDEDEEV